MAGNEHLIPEAPEGFYWREMCTLENELWNNTCAYAPYLNWKITGKNTSFPSGANWVYEYPNGSLSCPDCPPDAPANACYVSTSAKEYMIRDYVYINEFPCDNYLPDTAVYVNAVEVIYVLFACEDPDTDFPLIENNYMYSHPWSSHDPKNAQYIQDCVDVNGKLEIAYINCIIWYRCKSKPGWYWDDVNEIWVDTGSVVCVGVSGSNIIKEKSSYVYTVYYEKTTPLDYPITIFLSYNGGILTNGIDFTAPSNVIIPAGSYSQDFILKIDTVCLSKDDLIIKITPSSSETQDICESITSTIYCDTSIIPDIDDYTCAYTTYFWEPYKHSTRLP